MQALVFAPFLQNEIPFVFRTSVYLEERVCNTFDPLSINVGIGKSHIGGLIANRNGFSGDGRSAHTLMPVLDAVHGDSSALVNFHDPCASRGPCLDEEVF